MMNNTASFISKNSLKKNLLICPKKSYTMTRCKQIIWPGENPIKKVMAKRFNMNVTCWQVSMAKSISCFSCPGLPSL